MSTTAIHIYVRIAQAHDVEVKFSHGMTAEMIQDARLWVKSCTANMRCIIDKFANKYGQTHHWNAVAGIVQLAWHITCKSKYMLIHYRSHDFAIFGC